MDERTTVMSGVGHAMMTPAMTRRSWLDSTTRAVAAAIVAGVALPALASAAIAPPTLTVYKDPSCGCCTKWVAHLRANGLAVVVRDRAEMDALKDSLGIPTALRSCHTAVAGKYVIEGHVPAADIRRLLVKTPPGIVGLAVPDMPAGSPGMETGSRIDRYEVLAFSATGATHVFSTHG